MYSKILFSFIFSLFSLTACADSPSSPVPAKNSNASEVPAEEGVITALALKYTGQGPLGETCDVYLALEPGEEHGADEGEHGHAEHFLVKVDYTTPDGHKPHAAEGQFYQVDSGNFVEVDPEIPGADINFNSAVFNDESIEKLNSVKHLNELISKVQIEQAFRVEYNSGLDFHEYEEALESVLEDKSTFPANKALLDNMKSATLVLLHLDHYHTPVCQFNGSGLGASEVVETKFEMEAHEHEH